MSIHKMNIQKMDIQKKITRKMIIKEDDSFLKMKMIPKQKSKRIFSKEHARATLVDDSVYEYGRYR